MPADSFCAIASVRSRSPWVRGDRAKSEKGEAVGRCAPTQTVPQKAKETAASRLHCHWSPGLGREALLPCPPPFLRPRQAITANTGRRLGRVIIGESDKPISSGARSLAFPHPPSRVECAVIFAAEQATARVASCRYPFESGQFRCRWDIRISFLLSAIGIVHSMDSPKLEFPPQSAVLIIDPRSSKMTFILSIEIFLVVVFANKFATLRESN